MQHLSNTKYKTKLCICYTSYKGNITYTVTFSRSSNKGAWHFKLKTPYARLTEGLDPQALKDCSVFSSLLISEEFQRVITSVWYYQKKIFLF